MGKLLKRGTKQTFKAAEDSMHNYIPVFNR